MNEDSAATKARKLKEYEAQLIEAYTESRKRFQAQKFSPKHTSMVQKTITQ